MWLKLHKWVFSHCSERLHDSLWNLFQRLSWVCFHSWLTCSFPWWQTPTLWNLQGLCLQTWSTNPSVTRMSGTGLKQCVIHTTQIYRWILIFKDGKVMHHSNLLDLVRKRWTTHENLGIFSVKSSDISGPSSSPGGSFLARCSDEPRADGRVHAMRWPWNSPLGNSLAQQKTKEFPSNWMGSLPTIHLP